MNNPLMIVLIIVIIVILAPLIPFLIRKWDFRRQVKGKKPERKIKENETMPYYNSEDLSPKTERDSPDIVRRPPW